jgi:hypothetical protein
VLDLAESAATADRAIAWIPQGGGTRLTTSDRLRTALRRRAKVRWRVELNATVEDAALAATPRLS